jgi:glycerophosphoryl diester phosphodiesterase
MAGEAWTRNGPWLAADGAVKRIGHGGASAVVRGNTIASFDTAVEIGVDMIEFDVRGHGGRLVVAHNVLDARLADCLILEQALAHLSLPRFDGVGLNVDLKQPGCEPGTLDALRRFRLLERSLISSQYAGVLGRVRTLEPQARTAISVGGRLARWRQRWGDWRASVLRALGSGRFDALMVHHALVDASLVRAAGSAGGEVYAWTLESRGAIERVAETGVAGITTSDPRLFGRATLAG